MKIGLLISSFAAISYINLQLEAHKRYNSDLPLLVAEDYSRYCPIVEKLCAKYGCDYMREEKRGGHFKIDLLNIIKGLQWANENNFDYLIKISRRFVPLCNLRKSLPEDFNNYATIGNSDKFYGLLLRTESLVMNVKKWVVRLDKLPSYDYYDVENYMYNIANNLGEIKKWDLLGESRKCPSEKVLWHNRDSYRNYFLTAHSLGLNYKETDFINPNMLEGYRRF